MPASDWRRLPRFKELFPDRSSVPLVRVLLDPKTTDAPRMVAVPLNVLLPLREKLPNWKTTNPEPAIGPAKLLRAVPAMFVSVAVAPEFTVRVLFSEWLAVLSATSSRVAFPVKTMFPVPRFPASSMVMVPAFKTTWPESPVMLRGLVLKFKTPPPVFVNPWVPVSPQKMARRIPVPTLNVGEPAGAVAASASVPAKDEASPKRTLLFALPVAEMDPTVGLAPAIATSKREPEVLLKETATPVPDGTVSVLQLPASFQLPPVEFQWCVWAGNVVKPSCRSAVPRRLASIGALEFMEFGGRSVQKTLFVEFSSWRGPRKGFFWFCLESSRRIWNGLPFSEAWLLNFQMCGFSESIWLWPALGRLPQGPVGAGFFWRLRDRGCATSNGTGNTGMPCSRRK